MYQSNRSSFFGVIEAVNYDKVNQPLRNQLAKLERSDRWSAWQIAVQRNQRFGRRHHLVRLC